MRNTFTLIALFILTNILAQTPEKFSYQAVIRNSNNDLVANTQIGMRISILKTSINGSSVYTETHIQNTNTNGLVSVEIGTGNTTDVFSSINWSNDSYFVKTETDPTGGTNYTITGTSQLLSVPYALHAKTATSVVVQSNTTREYVGSLENFDYRGYRTGKSIYTITLDENNSFTATQEVVSNIDPDDAHWTGDEGTTYNGNGTYTENSDTISLFVNGSLFYTFNKVGNKLTYFEGETITEEDDNGIPGPDNAIGTTTEFDLTLKN